MPNVAAYSGSDGVLIENGGKVPITNTGSLFISIDDNKSLLLKNVLDVPSILAKLVSISKLCKDNLVYVEIHDGYFLVNDNITKRVLLQGTPEQGLYKFWNKAACGKHVGDTCQALLAKSSISHDRLAHVSENVLAKFFSINKIRVNNFVIKDITCNACALAETHKLPFTSTHVNASSPFDLVYIDIWGHAPYTSIDGNKYFLLIADDCTIFCFLHTRENQFLFFSIVRLWLNVNTTLKSNKYRVIVLVSLSH